MKYVPVLGVAPSKSTKTPVMHYFENYLISIAEPTTSRSWTLQDIFKQMKKIERLKLPGMHLYLDSGGYQVITGHITESRIKEYTDVYHFILKQFREDIDKIFSLDINTPKFSKEKLIKYNDYSIDESIKLIKAFPDIADKQLFVIQSRFSHILDDWLELMEKHQIEEFYTRYSLGGLVGLKQVTRAQFNHFVPMTIWLATYMKTKKAPTPKQLHMLGQSSRVALITGVILEKLTGINITMDSSEIIRFSPINAKVPLIHKNQSDYCIVNNLKEMEDMVCAHSDPVAHKEIESMKKDLQQGKVSNQTFVELICQNIFNLIAFSEQMLIEIPVQDLITWDRSKFEDYHDIFKIGRLSTEMENNMRLIRILQPYYENDNFDGIHKHVKKIIDSYYSDTPSKTGEL